LTKKAQMEVMGLMVIVLILVFVILLALKFFLVPKTTSEEMQRQSIQASNMLNAIIRSNTEDGSTIAKKIVECYNSANIDSIACQFMKNCYPLGGQCDTNKPSFLRDVLRNVFSKKKYRLEFTTTSTANILPIYGIDACNADEATITGSATVSVSPQITAKIKLCVQPQQSIS